MVIFYQVLNYVLLALGLGFVIFFHELGHFLAAKYCDVKVEQFAVGFGPAVVAWRKGIGFKSGTTTPAYEKIIEQHFDEVQKEQSQLNEKLGPSHAQMSEIGKRLGIGETEYRLNWIPLGGYVKMLGQDDLKPGVTDTDPRAYNNKSVGGRMMIVSAGVIMNVILAAIGFMIVFMIGYPVPPATVGGVVALSPASHAERSDGTPIGLQPGDQILTYNGKNTYGDFSKILLNVALTREGTRVPIQVRHPNGVEETLYATPVKPGGDGKGLIALGVDQPFELAGPIPNDQENVDNGLLEKTMPADFNKLKPGDVITQIAGKDVKSGDIAALYSALEASDGGPIDLTVKSVDGKISHITATAQLSAAFDREMPIDFLGMVPRATVGSITDTSDAIGKLKPGDVIVSLDGGTDHLAHPTPDQIMNALLAAGEKELGISMTVLDPGSETPRVVHDLTPKSRISGKMRLGIGMGWDEQHLVVATTLANSPAAAVKIPSGATLTAVDGEAVSNWFQIRRIISEAKPDQTLAITYTPSERDTKPLVAQIKLTAEDIQHAREITLVEALRLRPMTSPLQTHNPLKAIALGVVETRDLILQFYVTLQRMVTGDVSTSNMMGPVGMVHAGAQVASRGISWLLWFLCNISANLAVVNFLPIPIVDGGLFTLLILEKVQGKPLSQETQRIVQMVGLVLILGVFLIVTYQDIARMCGY